MPVELRVFNAGFGPVLIRQPAIAGLSACYVDDGRDCCIAAFGRHGLYTAQREDNSRRDRRRERITACPPARVRAGSRCI